MSRNRPIDWAHVASQHRALEAAGYVIDAKQPTHWHVRHPDGDRFVNVWPSVSKAMPDNGKEATRYVDVVRAVRGVLKSSPLSPKKMQAESLAALKTFRRGGAGSLEKYLLAISLIQKSI